MTEKNMSIGVMLDAATKKEFEKICKRNSVRISEALRDFVMFVIEEGEYPFEIVRKIELKEKHRR